MGTARKTPGWFTLGDPLRGVAAFGVLLFHAAMSGALSAPEHSDFGLAGRVLFNLDAGVFLFFVLSGYLIGRPFASAFILQTPFPGIGRFLLKRARRLLPGMVAAAVLGVAVFGTQGATPADLLASVGFAQVYATSGFAESATVHFWTLDAEGLFYVLLPLCALIAVNVVSRVPGPRRRTLIWVAGSGVVALASVAFRARGAAADNLHQQIFPSVAFAFAPGLALAGLEPVLEPVMRARPRFALAAARVLLVVSLMTVLGYFAVARQDLMPHSLLAATAFGVLVGAAVVRSWADAAPWRALDNRALQWLGERSYSLYLFHVAVVHLVTVQLAGGLDSDVARVALVTAVAVPISLVAAWAGYALVERPFMKLRPRREPDAPPVLSRA